MSNNNFNNFTDYTLPQNAYASFDAVSMRQLIIDRLNTNSIFKDQNFEGSNLNSLIDIIAYMYHVLLFYLNQTAAESFFSQSTLYENMNKIVSLLNYKPVGDQTSVVNIDTYTKASLPIGQYTIPRFSYIVSGGKNFSLVDDLTFEKITAQDDELVVTSTNVLYQGRVVENPAYIATGEDFETIFISNINNIQGSSLPTQRFISDNTFRIFVREAITNVWYEYSEVSSLYLASNVGRYFEKRLNENNQYEFKFGNDVNGRKLQENDVVTIYYIESDGSIGEITANSLSGVITLFQSSIFNSIKNSIYTGSNLISQPYLSFVQLKNPFDSIQIKSRESVDEIRANVPRLFSSQNRAVTTDDYTQYILKNFSDITTSAKTINNNEYVNNFLAYYYNLGLNQPNNDPSIMLNQVNFMTSTNFNNIYTFIVPKYGVLRNEQYPTTISIGQKQLIANELDRIKSATHQIVPMDPVYKAFAFGLLFDTELPYYQVKDDTVLVLKRNVLSNINREKIKSLAISITQDFFNSNTNPNIVLGGVVDLSVLSNTLLSIGGVTGIFTRRISNNVVKEVPFINMVVWNPNYSTSDIEFVSQSVVLENFEFPFLYEQSLISTKIIVEDE